MRQKLHQGELKSKNGEPLLVRRLVLLEADYSAATGSSLGAPDISLSRSSIAALRETRDPFVNTQNFDLDVIADFDDSLVFLTRKFASSLM